MARKDGETTVVIILCLFYLTVHYPMDDFEIFAFQVFRMGEGTVRSWDHGHRGYWEEGRGVEARE